MPPNKARYTKQYWGIRGNPFPRLGTLLKPEEQEFVFTGRDEDLDEFCSYTERPGGLFLYGLHGAGKTLFLLRSLAILEEQNAFCVYASFNPDDGFINSLLLAFLKRLGLEEPEWLELYNKLLGRNIKITRERTKEAGGEVALPFIKFSPKGTFKEVENIEQVIANPRRWLQDLIEELAQSNRQVILALDDLDNQEIVLKLEEEEVESSELSLNDIDIIVREARQLMTAGATVMLVGHPSGPTAALGSSNILNSFELASLDQADLVEMLKRYLALGRADGLREIKFDPFTEGAANLIANTITRLKLPTRSMLFACSELFEYCAREGIVLIDESVVRNHWPNVVKLLRGSLKRQDANYLRVIEESGGYDEDKSQAINEIAGPVAEFLDGLKKLVPLVHKELLIENARGTFKLNPLLAAQNVFTDDNLPEPDDMDAGEL